MVKQSGSILRSKAFGLCYNKLSTPSVPLWSGGSCTFLSDSMLCESRSGKDVLARKEPNSTAGRLGAVRLWSSMCCQLCQCRHISDTFLSTVNASLMLFSSLSNSSLFSVQFCLYSIFFFYRCEKSWENFAFRELIGNFPEQKASCCPGKNLGVSIRCGPK